jgi:hypothetical protein
LPIGAFRLGHRLPQQSWRWLHHRQIDLIAIEDAKRTLFTMVASIPQGAETMTIPSVARAKPARKPVACPEAACAQLLHVLLRGSSWPQPPNIRVSGFCWEAHR